ncbi:MAG: hypothetical protein V3571_13125 [Pseudodesulfovibrio sp.]
MLPPPYPSYSWPISQHIGPAANKKVVYALLSAAYKYAGKENYQDLITDDLVKQGILTPNHRQDLNKDQLWRDYQQILPELGLIISTKYTNGRIVPTPIGMACLDGAIGFSELVTTQCLNYQYPNGHKNFSSSLRKILKSSGVTLPSKMFELDTSHGVLIKPALLLLRILLELNMDKRENIITPLECLHALVPIKTNSDWEIGFNYLCKIKGSSLARDTRRIRHIQEWFRLLNLTDIFIGDGRGLSLTAYAKNNIKALLALCDKLSESNSYWIPQTDSAQAEAFSWFTHFGNPKLALQWLRTDSDMDSSYVTDNYPLGFEIDKSPQVGQQGLSPGLTLAPIAMRKTEQTSAANDPTVNQDKIIEGMRKRAQQTRLHDSIVYDAATLLKGKGFEVFEDRNSVDLLAINQQEELLIEVKTITLRNIASRLRLGVGQLAEYRYRREMNNRSRPSSVLVVSSGFDCPEWMTTYFENDIGMGLVSYIAAHNYSAYTCVGVENFITT